MKQKEFSVVLTSDLSKVFSEIAWHQPWFASVAVVGQEILAERDWRAALNSQALSRSISNHRGLPLHFIAQEGLPDGVAYETHISACAGVPTRDNLHDFFNALVWLRFPQIKRQLNALQAAQIAQSGIGKSRGSARDAATIFDENAALLVLEKSQRGEQLFADLKAHRWQQALYENAHLYGSAAQVWCFGHALMEKLVRPYKAITAHTWVVWVDPTFFTLPIESQTQKIDSKVAEQLRLHPISTRDYSHLPVLGIPTWWPKQDAEFYADTQVFRPPSVRPKPGSTAA